MDFFSIVTKLLLSFALGALIGLEREVSEKKIINRHKPPTAVLGLRTFSLAAVLGALTGILYSDYLIVATVLSVAFLSLLLVFYIFDSYTTKDIGFTTELAMVYSFLIGIFVSLDILPIQLIIALTVVLVLLLSRKPEVKTIVAGIQRSEINAFLSYAIIALVVLPFLPNISYALSDIPQVGVFLKNFGFDVSIVSQIDLINPFKLWLFVALITGIDLAGYFLEKTIGRKKGWLIASVAGGFVSSTATTQSLAQQSKTSKSVNHLLGAAIISNSVSFLQIAILISTINFALFLKIIPTILVMSFMATLIAAYFFNIKEEFADTLGSKLKHRIFNLTSALKFVSLFVVISILSKLTLKFFGESGFLATTAIGSLVGLDAVMINTAQLTQSVIDYRLGLMAFITANAVNLLGKSFYSFILGDRIFALKFFISIVLIILASFMGLLFI
ncbi:MgtC/SapB family protein [Candidatus Microgenomates bacterium]|nr:MgtC/SapB family protein [Candidatus Microgenomates bacterium]